MALLANAATTPQQLAQSLVALTGNDAAVALLKGALAELALAELQALEAAGTTSPSATRRVPTPFLSRHTSKRAILSPLTRTTSRKHRPSYQRRSVTARYTYDCTAELLGERPNLPLELVQLIINLVEQHSPAGLLAIACVSKVARQLLCSERITLARTSVQRTLKFLRLEPCPNKIWSLVELVQMCTLSLDGNPSSGNRGWNPRARKLESRDPNPFMLPPMFCALPALTELSLKNNQLEELPSSFGDLARLRNLNISGNFLIALPPSFARLQQLERLDASMSVKLEDATVLQQVPSLMWLSVGSSHHLLCEGLPTFTAASQLRALSFYRCERLTSVAGSVHALRHLTSLDLGECALDALPEAVCTLSQLKELCLHRNRVVSLPTNLHQLVSLERLGLDDQQVRDVATADSGSEDSGSDDGFPDGLRISREGQASVAYELALRTATLRAVRILDLSCYYCRPELEAERPALRLKRLPPALLSHASLEALHLESNLLETLPDVGDVLPCLRKLFLSNNRLRTLPASFGRLVGLQQLGLYDNLLASVPEAITHCLGLRILNLAGNQFIELPAAITALSSLRALQLGHHKLKKLPPLKALHELRALVLREKPVTQAWTEVLADVSQCPQLRRLVVDLQESHWPPSLNHLTRAHQAPLRKRDLTGEDEDSPEIVFKYMHTSMTANKNVLTWYFEYDDDDDDFDSD